MYYFSSTLVTRNSENMFYLVCKFHNNYVHFHTSNNFITFLVTTTRKKINNGEQGDLLIISFIFISLVKIFLRFFQKFLRLSQKFFQKFYQIFCAFWDIDEKVGDFSEALIFYSFSKLLPIFFFLILSVFLITFWIFSDFQITA